MSPQPSFSNESLTSGPTRCAMLALHLFHRRPGTRNLSNSPGFFLQRMEFCSQILALISQLWRCPCSQVLPGRTGVCVCVDILIHISVFRWMTVMCVCAQVCIVCSRESVLCVLMCKYAWTYDCRYECICAHLWLHILILIFYKLQFPIIRVVSNSNPMHWIHSSFPLLHTCNLLLRKYIAYYYT